MRSLFRRRAACSRRCDDVSFELRKGRTLGLVGESGCGKSTLARVLLRLLERVAAAIVFLNGRALPSAARQPAAAEPPRPAGRVPGPLFVARSAHDRARGHRRAAAHPRRKYDAGARSTELLGHVGLTPDAGRRRPPEFSGGQRQRIAIARALALNPDVLILDEAVSALDVSIQAQIINLLRKLQADLGLTYLFISHDLSVVRHIADEVAVMYLGRIVEHGPVRRLFEAPAHPYTQALLSAIPQPVRHGDRSSRIIL